MSAHLSPAELRGVLRLAEHDGGQIVRVHRGDPTAPVEVTVTRPIAGEHLLFVGEDGTPYRVGTQIECAAASPDGVALGNLLPLTDDDLAPDTSKLGWCFQCNRDIEAVGDHFEGCPWKDYGPEHPEIRPTPTEAPA